MSTAGPNNSARKQFRRPEQGERLYHQPLLRAVIGQATSAFRFRWVMDTGKHSRSATSQKARWARTRAPFSARSLPQSSILPRSRASRSPEVERRPFILYADEVQNFIHGVQLPTILSEARKYGLALTIATQVITQLPEASIDAVFRTIAPRSSASASAATTLRPLNGNSRPFIPATALQDLPILRLTSGP